MVLDERVQVKYLQLLLKAESTSERKQGQLKPFNGELEGVKIESVTALFVTLWKLFEVFCTKDLNDCSHVKNDYLNYSH